MSQTVRGVMRKGRRLECACDDGDVERLIGNAVAVAGAVRRCEHGKDEAEANELKKGDS